MKKEYISIILIFILSLLLISIVYAVSTTLLTTDNIVDDDGYLDLRGSCKPTSENNYDGTTSWNITSATLYSNVDGTWKANRTRTVATADINANFTYLFNFTNDINQSAEGEFKWNIQCTEVNASNDGSPSQTAFAGNNTIKVEYTQPTVSTDSPINNFYDLDGHEIPVVCKATASTAWNLTSVSLKTTIRTESGLTGENYTINQTYTPTLPEEGEVIANFTINKFGNLSISDGARILFACSATQQKNLSNTGAEPFVISEKSSSNKTLIVEYPPQVTLDKPADNNWSKFLRVNLNWTTLSTHTSGTVFSTRIWTNETNGQWAPATGIINENNNSGISQDYVFQEKTAIIWGVQVIQQDDPNVFNFSVNRTINLDATSPVISIPTSNQNIVTSDTTLSIVFTVTDTNIDGMRVFTNFSGTWKVNYTNVSLSSGVEANYFNNTAVVDGVYVWSAIVNDSSGRETTSPNSSLIIDTVVPTVSAVTNVSVDNFCDQRNITFTTNEAANFTLRFDTDIDVTDGTSVTSSVKQTSHGAIIDFNFNAEIKHFFNISVTDAAGNTNNAVGQVTFDTPARVCTGWSQYGVYDNLINLSLIQNQSGADLVYIWNATDQDWIFFTAGLSANGGVDVGFRTNFHVVHLFEDTNSTWFRNTTQPGLYNYNLTIGNNFLRVPGVFNFGNLTESFMNISRIFPSKIPAADNGSGVGNQSAIFGPFNFSFFAGYNNSVQDYVSHLFNFSFVNATLLEPIPNRQNTITSMEVFWIASGNPNGNVTWNGSAIAANWTI